MAIILTIQSSNPKGAITMKTATSYSVISSDEALSLQQVNEDGENSFYLIY